MKVIACFCFFSMIQLGTKAQNSPKPFAEAKKAIAHIENEKALRDSSINRYQGRLTFDFTYGQRFILPYNKTVRDTLTLADFTSRKSYYGLGLGYFINRNLFIQLGFDFQVLPRNQVINSFSFSGGGASGAGSGSGGFMFYPHIGAHYYFKDWKSMRPYAGLVVGPMNLIAKGGEVNFSTANGGLDADDIGELNASFGSAKLLFGIITRTAPGFMLDFNVGYSHTNTSDPIGGIKSPGAISVSLSMQFILNPMIKN